MQPSFWPTLGFELWPFAALVAVFVPISLAHERNFRRALAAYASLRAQAGAQSIEGAAADAWPSRSLSSRLALQPRLLVLFAVLLGWMTVTGIAGVLVWPRALPYFYLAINYYDRPYLWVFCSVGASVTAALVAVAVDLWRSPWATVARSMRSAVYASPERRAELFAVALASDPGLSDTPR